MSALAGCDQCGSTAPVLQARRDWVTLGWPTGQMVEGMFPGQQIVERVVREFCSLGCVGLFAASADAVAEVKS